MAIRRVADHAADWLRANIDKPCQRSERSAETNLLENAITPLLSTVMSLRKGSTVQPLRQTAREHVSAFSENRNGLQVESVVRNIAWNRSRLLAWSNLRFEIADTHQFEHHF